MYETKYFRLRADAVRRIIDEQDLKRYWVAEVAGVHKTTLRRWLSGEITRVREENMKSLATVLAADPSRIADRVH